MRPFSMVVLMGVVVSGVGMPRLAHACGGTFCDVGTTGQPPMPVDQTGENILFIQDGAAMEAHIQIQYTGEPQRFAWVVPLPALPEFRVGSDLLFRELLRASAPSYVVTPMLAEQCAGDLLPYLVAAPLALAALPLVGALFFTWVAVSVLGTSGCAADAALENLGPNGAGGAAAEVVFRDSVGAFDITVLRAGNADEVATWLEANNFFITANTRPILAQYAAENSLFAAVKLTSTAAVDEIHPIVLRYEYGIPCVPLRLTAVAATSDMGVRAFFLGQGRTVPRTYRHVEINPARVDWINAGANYKDVISRAVDDPEAAGQAFVTEYAGPSNTVLPTNFYWWGEFPLNVTTPRSAIVALAERGLLSCSGGFNAGAPASVTPVTPSDSCTFYHPLVRGLLQDHLPPPTGVTEQTYWNAPPEVPTFNAQAFVDDFQARIQRPAQQAAQLLATRGYLTRLFTTISPEEMTVDPEFHERADLPPVTNVNQATTQLRCDGYTTVTLPDGRGVDLPPGNVWPTFTSAMPWAQRVEDIADVTQVLTLAARGQQVDTELAAFNAQRKPAPVRQAASCAATGTQGLAPLLALAVLLSGVRRRKDTHA